MQRRWTEDEIWDWYQARPWISGFNFIPSGAVHGTFWMLQEYEHEAAFRDASKEIALAHRLGFTSVRLFLPFEIWRDQHDAFFAHLDEFLDLLGGYGMTLMPIIFNDCSVPRSKYSEPNYGPQPEPEPGYFGGSSVTPFDDDTQLGEGTVGYVLTDEPELEPVFEHYVRELAAHYGHDERVLVWNVWNEVGNSQRGDRSVPMMEKTFAWLREEDVDQPLTAEVWGGGVDGAFAWVHDPTFFPAAELRAAELSDLITFHYYGDYLHAKKLVATLKRYGRPMMNTEWMHRPYGSAIETHLPLWKREGIGSFFFGFVNGKAQFNYVWEFIKNVEGIDTSLWMHDIFHADFTPYDPDEIAAIEAAHADMRLPDGIRTPVGETPASRGDR